MNEYNDAVKGALDQLNNAGRAESHEGMANLLASAQVSATMAVAAATKELVELLRDEADPNSATVGNYRTD